MDTKKHEDTKNKSLSEASSLFYNYILLLHINACVQNERQSQQFFVFVFFEIFQTLYPFSPSTQTLLFSLPTVGIQSSSTRTFSVAFRKIKCITRYKVFICYPVYILRIFFFFVFLYLYLMRKLFECRYNLICHWSAIKVAFKT